MSLNFVLVPGPLVRASSWELTAKMLQESGHNVQIPDVLDNQPSPPAWRSWTSHLLHHITSRHEPILVGHSSASALVAGLAHSLPCRCVVIVDGDAAIATLYLTRPACSLRFYHKHRSQRWNSSDLVTMVHSDIRSTSLVGLDLLARDPIAFAECERGLPGCRSISSTIRSGLPAGTTFQPGSINARLFMIMQPRKRDGADGRY
jgi:predicted alpha/beta hydrolase family esterase